MENLNKYIEHTLLKQDATKNEVEKLCLEAKEFNFRGVCVNPCNIELAKKLLKDSDVKIVTVIGFPLGATCTSVKSFEAAQSIALGADEVDMVLNVGRLKDKDYNYVLQDIATVKSVCKGKVLKVILETDLLTKDEIKKASEICVEAKADFVKTSTGFVKNGVGAKPEDVKLMYDTVNEFGLKVKASGGVRSKEDAIKMVEMGAFSIGTSSGVQICQ